MKESDGDPGDPVTNLGRHYRPRLINRLPTSVDGSFQAEDRESPLDAGSTYVGSQHGDLRNGVTWPKRGERWIVLWMEGN